MTGIDWQNRELKYWYDRIKLFRYKVTAYDDQVAAASQYLDRDPHNSLAMKDLHAALLRMKGIVAHWIRAARIIDDIKNAQAN